MTVRNERYVCSASVVLSGHNEEEEESLQLAKTPWMDGPTGGGVWFSFCRWGNPPNTIRDINALKKEEERTQGAAVVLRVRCELKNGLFARNGLQARHVVEGYFRETIDGHLAVGRNECFCYPQDGRRLFP